MEPLDQALEVVGRVVAQVCEKLGSDAEDYINHDHVFVRAEHELQNGLDMAGAIDSIGSSLMWDVQQKLEDKIIRVKKIREELVRDSRHVMNEDTGKNWKIPVQEVQQSGDVEAVESNAPNGEVGKPSTNVNNSNWGSVSDSPVLPTSSEPDDDDIRVLTPVPRSPAPLIVLTDDSLDTSGPSTPSVSVVKEEPEVNEVRTQHVNETDLQNAENTDVARTDFETLNKEEISLTDASNNEQGDILNNNSSNSVVRNPVNIEENVEPIDLQNGDVAFDYSVGGIVSRQKEENSDKEKEVQQKVEVTGAAVPALKNGEEKDKGDLINFLSNNPVDYENPYDALWEEAYYVCSVLPYFELAQVHQSLMDHFNHSDRRACVLEEYYKLALNQDEDVPDVVFHGLLAARKRSYADVDDAELAVEGKKMKTNSSADHQQAAAIRMQDLVDNSQPSTSGGNYSLTQAPVVADMSIAKSYNDNPYGNNLMEGDPVIIDKAREQWCKEKLEFVCAVVYGVHESTLRAQIRLCFTDDDIQRLMERLLREQEEGGSGVAQGPVERGNPVSAAQAVLPAPSAFNVVDKKNKGASFAGPSQGASGDGATPCSSGEAEAEDPADLEDRIAAQVATLSEMFSDADPDYLQER